MLKGCSLSRSRLLLRAYADTLTQSGIHSAEHTVSTLTDVRMSSEEMSAYVVHEVVLLTGDSSKVLFMLC